MKKIRTIISLFLLLTCVITLTACGNEEKKEEKEQKEEVKEEIVITLDTDGGEPVQNIKIEKGKTTTLPETKKDGYTFEGWYLEDKKISDDYVFEADVTLKAKWTKIEVKPKTFTVSFDSNGGSKVKSITVECNSKLPTLPTPTKDFYVFVSWADKHGKVIGKGALLACENVTLYANWEYDGPVANPEQNDTKTYTCPEGYYLDGTKCKTTKEPTRTCPGDTKVDGSLCIRISDYVQGTRTCGKKTVHYGGGHTEEVQGVKVEAGTTFCYYGEVKDSYENNQANCTSRGHKWANSLSKCFVDMDQNYITECPLDYQYYTSAQILEKFGGHNNGGCYKKVAKNETCDTANGYVLTAGSCVKTIDATLK